MKLRSRKHRKRLFKHLSIQHADSAEEWLEHTPRHIIDAHKPLKQKNLSKNIKRAQIRLQHLVAGNHFTKLPFIFLEGPPGFGQNTVINMLFKSLLPEQLQIRPLSVSLFQRPSVLIDSIDPSVLTVVHGSVLHPNWPLLSNECSATAMQRWFDSLGHVFNLTPIALFVSRKKQLRTLTKMDKKLGTARTKQVPTRQEWDRQHLERLRALISHPTRLDPHSIEWTLANGNHKAALKLSVLERIIASIESKATHCDSESVSSPTGTSTALSRRNAASDTNDKSSSVESSASADPSSLVGAE